MGRPAKDWTAIRVGLLVPIERVGKVGCSPVWLVKCDCGSEVRMTTGQLSGRTRSCGCWKRENGTRLTHGMGRKGGRRSRVYRIWNAMRQRCGNPNQPHYARYGGLGVTVCERWEKFENFYADMGDPPTDTHSLDRIDPFGNYEPGNCRWATREEQARNTRRTRSKGT